MIKTVDNVAEAAGALLLEKAEESIRERGRFVVVLSGGSTPLKMYAWLIEGHADAPFWEHTHVFWGDERFVPHEHPDSNYGAAKRALLDALPIPSEQVYPWLYGAGDPEGAAHTYADTLQQTLADAPFDLTFLGLGDDAHTASLFPGTGAVFDEGLTTVVRPPGKGTRLSLTARRLSRSRTIAFLVQGEGKRDALSATLSPTETPDFDRTPARAISAQEELVWLTDVTL
ncbi:MAG: 6-phosphogluconolactonase, eukaryotic type [uncultured Truepera sp.]|uniref:6-phosphogluconolactonase n=1 Tax=uncultured Truepera sp. TaxID=543023 RepID=A0A6J4V0C5_9DEIN|nr:MAG: 6-phosphogluconolactonase, eukaryotic type [uncultured Truepera sp.]